jgi:microcystin-dependent protein
MSSLLPTPEPADPVEGAPGHFEHTNWVKRALKALDAGLLRRPTGTVPAGRVLGTTAENTWDAIDPVTIGGVPRGVIVAFHGSTIPGGWAVCDGSNGTPNLKDRFILGAGTAYAAGSDGGEAAVTLSAAQSGVPAHSHTSNDADAAHSHSIKQRNLIHSHGMNGAGGHNHTLSGDDNVIKKGDGGFFRRITGGASGAFDATGGVGDHTHAIHNAWDVPDNWTFPVEQANATHKHTINANAAAAASQPHNNMPPYYALVYIMKL